MADRISAEQQARNMLERIGVHDAQSYSASDLIELANLIAERNQANSYARVATMPKLGFTADLELDQRGGAFQRMPLWPDQSSKPAAPPPWPEPDTDAVLTLAGIIREVDGNNMLGAAALAEAILCHPDAAGVFSSLEPGYVVAGLPDTSREGRNDG